MATWYKTKQFILGCIAVGILAILVLVLCLGLKHTEPSKVSYKNWMVLRTKVVLPKDLEVLNELTREDAGIITCDFKHLNISDLHFQRHHLQFIKEKLEQANIQYLTLIEDKQELIDKVESEIQERRLQHKSDNFDLGNFHSNEEITTYLNELARTSNIVKVVNLGQTHEQRDILMAVLSTSANSRQKPIIFLDCMIHSYEWISGAACLWIVGEISQKYGKDAEVTELLDAFDWYIKPVANPDGYIHSWTTDRLWRKNRAPFTGSPCVGVNLNRNFDSAFEENDKYSNPLDPCSRLFKGLHAFSEQETKAIRDVMVANKDRIKLALFVHNYGQLWMSPYGKNLTLPPHYDQMESLMNTAAAAIEAVNGTKYHTGTIPSLLYPVTSTSMDYAYDKLGIIHSYAIELPDQGEFGYIAPVSKILPVAGEFWAGVKAAAFFLMQ